MGASLHDRVIAAATPRPKELVEPYVRHGIGWMRQMLIILGGLFFALGVVMGLLEAAREEVTLVEGLVTGIGYAAALGGLLILLPVGVFYNSNANGLRRLLRSGHLTEGKIVERGHVSVKGNEIPKATVSFTDLEDEPQTAVFVTPDAKDLSVDDSVKLLLEPDSNTVAVLWAPEGVAYARVQ